MNKEFKKYFLASLMAVLLVVSNLLGMKLTNFLDITIGVDFITFPWTFLCTLLILNIGDQKDAYRSILVAALIQLLITISYTIAVSLGNQTLMPDGSLYVNALFKVDEMNILGSVLAFTLSHCLLIYIYENFKHYNKELYGLVIGLLGATFVHSFVYLIICLRDYEAVFVINMLLSNIIINIIIIIIITIMFYILKEKDNFVVINKTKPIENKDLSIEEVMSERIKTDVKTTKPKTTTKMTSNNSKTTSKKKSTTQKNPKTHKNTYKKSTTTSKPKVKKDNN